MKGLQQARLGGILLPLLLLFSQPVGADDFEVMDAQVTLKNDIYHLNGTIRYPLGSELSEALHQGVVIPIKVIIEVYTPNRYLPETEVAFLKQRYELRFHALTRQYVVINHNSSVSNNYGSLAHALQRLGEIKNLPIIDQNLLEEGVEYRLRIRAAINTGRLAIPLRLTSYFYGPWRNESEWWDLPLKEPLTPS
ncbi:hypothetical protein MNBD_GAMMA18-287 [hydrothermal vent metagenome]|uniref:DUF4390 domain-containing protein n=1 Tax=hydrothermal vent metagenome TaxID=652676 RepID=A0A3B1A3I0_9ZZZZ